MEWLVGNGRDAVALDKETGGKKQVTFTQLQSAFQQMKRKI
jgi:hypothetical protein